MAQCSVRSSTLSLSHRLQGPKRNVFRQASRFTSTVTASANNSSRNAAPAAAHGPQEPLTLLHKVSSLLPRALDGQGSGSSLTVDIWEKVLARAFEDLSSSAQRPLNITVYGLDRAAGAEDLVTALVVDPLGSDEQWKAVHERWSGSASNHLNISHDAQISTDITASTIRVPSTYLQRFPVPIEITELRSASSPITSSGMLDGKTLTALFQSDIPILVCNPLLTSLPTLLSTTLFPQKTIIILRSPHVQQSTCDIIQTLLANVPPNAPKPTIILADPSRASSAVRSLLHSNQRSSSVVQRFQDDFIGSNVSAITQVLQELLQAPEAKAASSSKHQKGTASDYLRVKFGLLRLEDAVAACLSSIRDVKSQLDQTSLLASRLETLVEEEREKVEIDVLGPVEGSPQTRNARGNQVAEALKVAEVQMQDVMNRLTWWRMIWRVDEITGLVAAAMERTWCPELERKLLVQTGKLAALQNQLSAEAYKLLHKNPNLPTQLLRNSLQQLESSPHHKLTTTSLTSDITSRRNQIIEYPTARLHLAGQRAVAGMATGVCGGAGVGWLGWMGWLVQGEGLLAPLGLEPNTAMAVGALSAVASIRWAVGQWEKGKKKWWEDWHRVGEGLDRDLRATVNRSYRDRVAVLAQTSASGVRRLVERREGETAKLEEDTRQLQADLKKGGVNQS